MASRARYMQKEMMDGKIYQLNLKLINAFALKMTSMFLPFKVSFVFVYISTLPETVFLSILTNSNF